CGEGREPCAPTAGPWRWTRTPAGGEGGWQRGSPGEAEDLAHGGLEGGVVLLGAGGEDELGVGTDRDPQRRGRVVDGGGDGLADQLRGGPAIGADQGGVGAAPLAAELLVGRALLAVLDRVAH